MKICILSNTAFHNIFICDCAKSRKCISQNFIKASKAFWCLHSIWAFQFILCWLHIYIHTYIIMCMCVLAIIFHLYVSTLSTEA